MKSYYDEFYRRMHFVGDQINLKKVRSSPRKGTENLVHKAVFLKSAFQNGQSWAALPSSLLQWTALTPIAIANVNEVFKFLNFPFIIPLSWGSLVAVGVIASLLIFGVFAWTHTGIIRDNSELGALQNSSLYLTFVEQQEIKEMISDLNKRIESMEKKL